MKAEVARIYASLIAKIASEADFGDKIADPSSAAYADFLATVGAKWDAVWIKLKQKVKLAGKYDTWKARVDEVLGGGTPTFPDIVTAKKGRLSELRRVIGVVGHKALGTWEPASMAVLLARGDTRCATYFDTNDTFTGTLDAVFDARKGALISPALIAEMVQACVMTKYADEAGLTAERGTIISESNTRLDALIQVGLNTVHKGTGYDFTIVLSWNATNNNVDITATDTHP